MTDISERRPHVHVDLHLVLLREGKVLLGKRLNTRFGADQYHVPAGHLEADETVVDGIVREAREETGIALSSDDVDFAYVMHFRGESDRLGLFFTAKRWSGEIRNLEPLKCAGWEWFDTAQLPENLVPYARHALLDILSGRRLGLFGWTRQPSD
jgi:ADP-ribose pyrophosphatase YjhB (NUDIX family)